MMRLMCDLAWRQIKCEMGGHNMKYIQMYIKPEINWYRKPRDRFSLVIDSFLLTEENPGSYP